MQLGNLREDRRLRIFARHRKPSIAVCHDTPEALGRIRGDVNRRMRTLRRLGPRKARGKRNVLPLKLGLLFGPELLHGFNPLAHELKARGKVGSMLTNFEWVPAAAYAEIDSATRQGV